MPLFRCSIRGENFPGELIGLTTAVGFHATRFVDAESATEAEQIGVSRERLRESYRRAYHIRRRYTVLDLAVQAGVLEDCLDRIFGGR